MPSLLLDTEKIQKRVDRRNQNPFEWKVGTFHVPTDMGRDMFEHQFALKVRIFMEAMRDSGWDLCRKADLRGPFEAFDLDTGLLIPGHQEWRVRGYFKYVGPTPKAERIELDPARVKQAPDHELSTENPEDLKAAIKDSSIEKIIEEDAYTT